jgi:ABC-2 type transport system ATP-binding protein
MELAIETNGLSKQYGRIQALADLDLRVPRNTIFGFLGPNGAGKSTTIKLLLGLIKPTAGRANVLGYDVIDESLAVRERIGYLAQHPRFYPYMTVQEVLRLSGSLNIDDPAELNARVEASLAMVDLEAKANRRVAGLSGGETQRLGIAQAQIHQPDVLILDEPAAALDPMGREKVLAIMEQLRSKTTIFFSTHILDDVQRVSDRVAILNQGRLVTQAPTSQLLAGADGVAYLMTTRGNPAEIKRQLGQLPWVSQLECCQDEEGESWRIVVDDQARAEQQLLRAVLQVDAVNVIEFGQQRAELEDIFMQLVNGDS